MNASSLGDEINDVKKEDLGDTPSTISFPIVNVDELGRYQFVIFDKNAAEILISRYRICCDMQETGAFFLLPEMVQVLYENGFISVRRIPDISASESFPPKPTTSSQMTDEQELNKLAYRVLIGRRIKAQKRKALGSDADSTALKVHKREVDRYIDEEEGANRIESIETNEEINMLRQQPSEAELQAVVDELKAKKTKTAQSASELPGESTMPELVMPNDGYERVEEPEFPSNLAYQTRVTTFRDLWRKGFYLTPGAKFGCDFLAYEKSPDEVHSTYMVLCKDADDSLYPLDLIAVSRLATQVKKCILLSIVSGGSLIPYYIKMNWWKGDR